MRNPADTMHIQQASWTGPEEKMTYAFANNLLTDNKEAAMKEDLLVRSLGTIRIELRDTVYTPKIGRHNPTIFKPISRNVFDEKAKKLIRHSAQGITKPYGRSTSTNYTGGPYGDPIVFIFKYRCKDWLQAEDYIPYPVSATQDTIIVDGSIVKNETQRKANKDVVAEVIDLTDEWRGPRRVFMDVMLYI